MGLGNMFGRMAIGAAGGYALTGSWGGAAGGAAGGFAFPTMAKFAGGLNAGGILSGAANRLGSLAGRAAVGIGRRGWDSKLSYAAYGRQGLSMAASGLWRAGGFMGRNAVAANKYAGYAVAGLGAASGAYIGNSVISSNRGY
jgi:hypothetical protein